MGRRHTHRPLRAAAPLPLRALARSTRTCAVRGSARTASRSRRAITLRTVTRRRTLRHATRLVLTLLALCGPAVVAPAQSERPADVERPQPGEYDVKAACLFKLTKFVEWPGSAFDTPETPLVIGVLGPDPFGERLDRIVADRTVRGHPVRIRRFASLAELGPVHVLFVGHELAELTPLLAALNGTSVLLVGERPRFAQEGGIVNFYCRGSRVRFEVNLEGARERALVIDAKLLELARIVRS